MSDENKIRDAADAIKGIAEAVPVYQDVVQPAAKEIGTALQTVAKTVHVALAPISALVWGYEKIKDYLNDTLTEKLKHVPKERIVPPNLTVAGPAVEALRFSAHEPSLRELYANLLATAMDAKTAQEAHPAFVEILRQLSPDEAHLVAYISKQKKYTNRPMEVDIPLISGMVIMKRAAMKYEYPVRHLSLLGEKAGCTYPELVPSYLDNLRRLGVTEILTIEHVLPRRQATYKKLVYRAKTLAKQRCKELFHIKDEEFRKETHVWSRATLHPEINKEILRFTALGVQFDNACVSDKVRV
jgi:hypothetical protein